MATEKTNYVEKVTTDDSKAAVAAAAIGLGAIGTGMCLIVAAHWSRDVRYEDYEGHELKKMGIEYYWQGKDGNVHHSDNANAIYGPFSKEATVQLYTGIGLIIGGFATEGATALATDG